jgi:hypothetical protein
MESSTRASFKALFEEWELNRTVGVSILTSIQNSLELLRKDPSSSSSALPSVKERLLAMCPSAPLKAYFSGKLHREDRESQRAALELQDNYILLQTCAKKAIRLAEEMRELAESASQDHLASSLSYENKDLEEVPEEDKVLLQGEEEEGHQGLETDIPARSDDEILLMMSALASALILESNEVMGRVSAAINLETSAEDLFGYIQMWKLAPFVDEGLSSDLITSLGGSQ